MLMSCIAVVTVYCMHLLSIVTDSFLAKFPYCLPNMFTALLCVLGVAAVGCLLPDEPEAKNKRLVKDLSIRILPKL